MKTHLGVWTRMFFFSGYNSQDKENIASVPRWMVTLKSEFGSASNVLISVLRMLWKTSESLECGVFCQRHTSNLLVTALWQHLSSLSHSNSVTIPGPFPFLCWTFIFVGRFSALIAAFHEVPRVCLTGRWGGSTAARFTAWVGPGHRRIGISPWQTKEGTRWAIARGVWGGCIWYSRNDSWAEELAVKFVFYATNHS